MTAIPRRKITTPITSGGPRPNQAVPVDEDGGSLALEATPVGVGAREVPRRELDDAEVERLVRAEVTERREAARVCEDAGQPERAGQLRQEADALAAVAGLPPAL